MTEFSHTVTETDGLHARPAGLLTKKALQYKCDIFITSGGRRANLKHIFAVMALNVRQGDTVAIQASGQDEAQAIDALQGIVRQSL